MKPNDNTANVVLSHYNYARSKWSSEKSNDDEEMIIEKTFEALETEFSNASILGKLIPSLSDGFEMDIPATSNEKLLIIETFNSNTSNTTIRFRRGCGGSVWIIINNPSYEDDDIDESTVDGVTIQKSGYKYKLCRLRKMFEWNSLQLGLVEVVSSTVQLEDVRQEYTFDIGQYESKWELITLDMIRSYAILINSILDPSKTYIVWNN